MPWIDPSSPPSLSSMSTFPWWCSLLPSLNGAGSLLLRSLSLLFWFSSLHLPFFNVIFDCNVLTSFTFACLQPHKCKLHKGRSFSVIFTINPQHLKPYLVGSRHQGIFVVCSLPLQTLGFIMERIIPIWLVFILF